MLHKHVNNKIINEIITMVSVEFWGKAEKRKMWMTMTLSEEVRITQLKKYIKNLSKPYINF